MPNLSILVVEDDPLARELMADELAGHRVDLAPDFETGRRKLEGGRHDLCFIDLKLGKGDTGSGLKLIPLAAAKGSYPVVMSSHDSERVVEEAYALGCRDFYAKGNMHGNVAAVLARYQERLAPAGDASLFETQFVTDDPATRAAVTTALRYAPSDLPLLILGPSGTGKTRLAQLLHDRSGRQGRFVAINCASYTEDLLEAELFGHKKGTFTDATEDRRGKLLLADGGTLFLDEIGAMSAKMQTKLLKAIEEKSFYPLGSEKPVRSSFRVVSATLEDIPALIKSGKLRLDFFQRIHGFTVELRPLSSRPGDIAPLVAAMTQGGRRLSFTPEAKAALARHEWPGNVRELKRLVELLVAGEEGRVTAETVARLLAAVASKERPGGDFITDEQYRHALANGLNATIERITEALIKRNFAENGGVKARVKEDLKIATRILYKVLPGNTASGGTGA
ncbi:MAG: sigma-54-dependent Fis family transcriptional regulator [Elusimicrobia bacterium]|nr:sigma-54-dependent Fis family transcriptional regulator [Elusimicrobiota bacterium]